MGQVQMKKEKVKSESFQSSECLGSAASPRASSALHEHAH